MPEEQNNQEQQSQGFDYNKLQETVDKSVSKAQERQRQQEEMRKRVVNYIEQKVSELNDTGKEKFKNYISQFTIPEGKTPEEVIDEKGDGYLEDLQQLYSAGTEEGDQGEKEPQPDKQQKQTKKEPTDKGKGVQVESDEDDIPEQYQQFDTLEGYVKAKKDKLANLKRTNRY